MDPSKNGACGSHGAKPNGKPLFDYICDDCMLPANHLEYDQDPAYIKIYGRIDNQKRDEENQKFAQADEQPF